MRRALGGVTAIGDAMVGENHISGGKHGGGFEGKGRAGSTEARSPRSLNAAGALDAQAWGDDEAGEKCAAELAGGRRKQAGTGKRRDNARGVEADGCRAGSLEASAVRSGRTEAEWLPAGRRPCAECECAVL